MESSVPSKSLYPNKFDLGMVRMLKQLHNAFFYSGCVFSILFPLFIISGNEADPVTGAW